MGTLFRSISKAIVESESLAINGETLPTKRVCAVVVVLLSRHSEMTY